MAKQKGIIKLRGSLGGITFYQMDGQSLVRTTSGPDKSKIQNDPSYARTRENNQEFSGAAAAGKSLRMAILKEFPEMTDLRTTGRILRLTKTIVSRGTGTRGQRIFNPVAFRDMLVNFSFSEKTSFDSIFHVAFSSEVNAERNEVTLTVPGFNARNLIEAPSGATHFRIINVIGVISQFNYDSVNRRYEPTDPASNEQNAFAASDYIPVGQNIASLTTIVASLTPAPTLAATSALISCIGIEFYQEVGGQHYLFASNNALKIHAVY